MNPRYHLTFDVDWAPDAAVRQVLATLAQHEVKATFFVTHASDTIAEMRAAGHELGVHPNFLLGSSHGATPAEVMQHVMALVPDARVVRTHALVQSTPLLEQIFRDWPQLKVDMSLYLHRFAHVAPHQWRLGNVAFTRVHYNFEDDMHFADPAANWGVAEPLGPLTVYDFHPIHVALNSANEEAYAALKRRLNGAPMQQATPELLAQCKHAGKGAADSLDAILASDMQPLRFSELLCV